MTFLVRFEPATPGFVEVTADGSLSRTEAEAMWADAVAGCAEQDCWRMLFDAHAVTDGPDQVALFHLGERSERLPRSLMMAVLGPDDAAGRRMAAFWETTATNRGMLVRRFNDRDDALAWLGR